MLRDSVNSELPGNAGDTLPDERDIFSRLLDSQAFGQRTFGRPDGDKFAAGSAHPLPKVRSSPRLLSYPVERSQINGG